MSADVEPVPKSTDPTTWYECLATGCTRRIPPAEHSFRCAEHRADRAHRPAMVATPDETLAALDDLEQLDRAAAWRVLVLLAQRHPTSVWQAVTHVGRQLEHEHRQRAGDTR